MPKKICSECIEQIYSAFSIKHKILETDKLLRSQIKHETEIKTESEDPIEFQNISVEEEFVTEVNCEEMTKDDEYIQENIRKKPNRTVKKILMR